MESNEFYKILNNFPFVKKVFKGVCSIDTIPKLKKFEFVICNTDVSAGSGRHWFVLGRFSKSEIECFDSLGVDDDKKAVIKTILTKLGFNGQLQINLTPVQASTTDSCGKFCLYFILERLFNPDLTLDDLLNSIFEDNCLKNEINVQNFFIEQIAE